MWAMMPMSRRRSIGYCRGINKYYEVRMNTNIRIITITLQAVYVKFSQIKIHTTNYFLFFFFFPLFSPPPPPPPNEEGARGVFKKSRKFLRGVTEAVELVFSLPL